MNKSKSSLLTISTTAIVAGVLALPVHAQDASIWPVEVEVVDPPMNTEGKTRVMSYSPVETASKSWNICVSFPHLKDAYWLGANYGLADEAKRLGVTMTLLDAGGYGNLETQREQIKECAATSDVVVVGAISATDLNDTLKEIIAQGKPVVDLINGINEPTISAKTLVSFVDMGKGIGQFLAEKHPAGGEAAKVAWFPGPQGAGWVEAANTGFQQAIEGTALEIVATEYGDTGRDTQDALVKKVLADHPDVKYIVGNAVAAEGAVSVLRREKLTDKVDVLAFYMTPSIHRAIKRGKVLAAPTDQTVVQGRLAINQAVRILEGQPFDKHLGPKIEVLTQADPEGVAADKMFAPNGFKPVYSVLSN